MSSAFIKGKLKEGREAIQQKNWEQAEAAVREVLQQDPDHYNANVFLGLALLNLERFEESEQVYRKAIDTQPDQPLAYQGLEKFYTQRSEYAKLLLLWREQADVALNSEDATKCGENVQKIVGYQRKEGARSEKAEALSLLLPGSKYYELLSTLPPPEPTKPSLTTTFEVQMAIHLESLLLVKEIISLTEELENQQISKEVEKKRMRIEGAGKTREMLRNEAGISIWKSSSLPSLYEQLLSHPKAEDEERREAEGKLLRYHHRLLLALPWESETVQIPTGAAARGQEAVTTADEGLQRLKLELLHKVEEMSQGMVIVGVADELAWTINLEWQDFDGLATVPRHLLRQMIQLFPRSGRAAAARALLLTLQDEPFLAEMEAIKKATDVDNSNMKEDPLTLAANALEEAPQSLLTHRVAARLYLVDQDFVTSGDIASKALALLRDLQRDSGKTLPSITSEFTLLQGIAQSKIVGNQAQARATRLLDSVLSDRISTDALFARASIEARAGRWSSAAKYYTQILDHTGGTTDNAKPSDILSLFQHPQMSAAYELSWCSMQQGDLEGGRAGLVRATQQFDAEGLPQHQFRDEDRAEAWWRLGECLCRLVAAGQSEASQAFDAFITCLKRSASFAPAFASLGIYYESMQIPPDPARSAKCFQKAFELDATQFLAAQRLAQHYAEERDWELVSMIARRVIEGEGGLHALGAKSIAQQKHQSINAWAWKAIGVVRLQKGEAEDAINPLQVALRAEPEDAITWQRLGEAYHRTGRHTAALKSLARAQELDSQSWETLFRTFEIQRDLGKYDHALLILDSLLGEQYEFAPEVGCSILAAYASTLCSRAESELDSGSSVRAEVSLLAALSYALQALTQQSNLKSCWKVVSDTLFHLGRISMVQETSHLLESLLIPLLDLARAEEVDESLPAIASVTMDTIESLLEQASSAATTLPSIIQYSAAYICKLRVIFSASETRLAGPTWADLAVSLSILAAANSNLPTRESSEHTKEAISCIKEALNNEPANPSFWIILGNLTFKTSVNIAQHAYIRAIEADRQDSRAWCCLGLLYLHHDDPELASEALLQAQTLNPDDSVAWVGQGLIAQASGQLSDARRLFSQAVELGGTGSAVAACGLASSYLPTAAASLDLSSASFALTSYLAGHPKDVSALHLSALICERLGQYSLASDQIESAAHLLEQEFETSEDAATAVRYAIAQTNLGRIRCSIGDVSGAQEAIETAQSLLTDNGDDDDETGDAQRQRIQAIASGQISLAIVHSSQGNHEAALATLDSETSQTHLWVQQKRLRTQILWAQGTPESQAAAKEALLADLSGKEEDGQGALSAAMLLAIGISQDDEDLIEAAAAELDGFTAAQLKDIDQAGSIRKLEILRAYFGGKNDQALHQRKAQANATHDELAIDMLRRLMSEDEPSRPLLQEALSLRSDSNVKSLRVRSAILLVDAVTRSEDDSADVSAAVAADALAQLAVIADPADVDTWNSLLLIHSM